MTQVEPAEILRSANERSNGGKRRRRYPTSHNTPLNTSPCFSPSNLDASSPTDSASGNTLAPPRTPPDEPSASVPNDFFGSETSQTALAAGREKYNRANGQVCDTTGLVHCSKRLLASTKFAVLL